MRITITFEYRQQARNFAGFIHSNRGDSNEYNYFGLGELATIDWALGTTEHTYVYIDRNRVKNFARLAQDIAMFGGKIHS
ncbi:hypothetical protein FACS189440_02340 [Bacteroidia bacterium]|nr:hypothetical protein FACS189423_01970 [Bacteroidia bacterium]GHT45744.1 hypothetical protein FACS189440_02340 [Bacteroidia bacterium]